MKTCDLNSPLDPGADIFGSSRGGDLQRFSLRSDLRSMRKVYLKSLITVKANVFEE